MGSAYVYTLLDLILYNQGLLIKSSEYHNKALKIHKELQDKVGMARDYGNIGLVLYYSLNDFLGARDALSKAKNLLQSFEDETGYHHPLHGKIDELMKMVIVEEKEEETQ
jgi:tetratricopeptide (TPR) repeat protein